MSNNNKKEDWMDQFSYTIDSAPGHIFYHYKEMEEFRKKKERQEQLDRIEAKLDKLLGPQLINGVWR